MNMEHDFPIPPPLATNISLVMDVSGSLQEAPDKQLAVYEFLHNFVRLFDAFPHDG